MCEWPRLLTAVLEPLQMLSTCITAKPVGKIFIDYLRNGKGATTINSYAVRRREGLPVSVPIFKEEIHDIKGAIMWTIHNLHERLGQLGADPWQDHAKTNQTITAERRRRVGLKNRRFHG
jgi:bifunctional non-homologous end joining protein LigD